MKHWIRDAKIVHRGGADNGGYLETLWCLYHFLRNAGWTNIWEIDGNSNHVPDGSMEDTGATSWTANGGSVVKDTTTVHMGRRSLKYTSGTTTSDSVESSDFTNMQVGGLAYRIRLQIYNNSGRAWVVEWTNDNGVGWNTGPSVPSTGGWAEYTVSMTSHAAASTGHRFRVRDLNNPGSGADIYVDSVFAYRSFFEDLKDQEGTLGQITAPDQFQTTEYTFVNSPAPTGDVGKFIAIWDATNLGNSGLYQISAVAAGVATLDLRAGGSPTLVSQTNLAWRMIDVGVAPYSWDPGVTEYHFCGFGLQSPHAEDWRIFFRHNWTTTSDQTWIDVWSSPTDADFDVDEGDFYNYEPSTRNYGSGTYTKGSNGGTQHIVGRNNTVRSASAQRLYAMTDDDGSFLAIGFRDFDGSYADEAGGGIVGFSGADSYHTLRQSFVSLFTYGLGTNYDDWGLANSSECFGFNGAQCTDVGVGWMTQCVLMVLGLGSTTTDELDLVGPSYRANPFDGNYWTRKPVLARDYFGSLTNNPTQKDMTGLGLWHSSNSPQRWSTIDSNAYFHFGEGIYWEWFTGHTPLV